MRTNTVLQKLQNGQQTVGVWVTVGSPIIAEELALAGFDWILIDVQHGYMNPDTLVSMIQVISHTDTVPLARVDANTPLHIGKALDAGALGVVVPMVNSPEDAQRAVAAAYYPPIGSRSAGGSRLLLYSDDYFSSANDEILLAVMLETTQAVEHAESILSVSGVDCGFVGPGDLAIDLGTADESSDVHEDAIQRVLDAGQRAGVPVGIACGDAETARQRAAQGFQFVDAGSDIGFIWSGVRDAQTAIGKQS